jgi:hypothetical protein
VAVKFSPASYCQGLPVLASERWYYLPDIIDIRCHWFTIALYFYPISSWHWSIGWLEDGTIVLPTMLINYLKVYQ